MKSERTRFRFRLGLISGWFVAPVFGLISRARRARTFHPRGPVYQARAVRHACAPLALYSLADQLTGDVLARFSGALWKTERSWLPEVLGCALRFRRTRADSPLAADDDQDLLFATIRRPWTMALSPWTTATDDYLANDYFAVSPFDSQEVTQPFYLRLHPAEKPAALHEPAITRSTRLSRAVRTNAALLDLELSAGPFGPWQPLLTLQLHSAANIDGEALRFQPFRNGRGIRPHGFIHALRRGVYSLSQRSRPSRSPTPAAATAYNASDV